VHAKAFAGIIFQERNPFHDFALGFFQNLAFFACERAGDFVGALAGDIRGAPQNSAALGTGRFLPVSKCRLRRFDGALNIFAVALGNSAITSSGRRD
jgi:hypothetical protein